MDSTNNSFTSSVGGDEGHNASKPCTAVFRKQRPSSAGKNCRISAESLGVARLAADMTGASQSSGRTSDRVKPGFNRSMTVGQLSTPTLCGVQAKPTRKTSATSLRRAPSFAQFKDLSSQAPLQQKDIEHGERVPGSCQNLPACSLCSVSGAHPPTALQNPPARHVPDAVNTGKGFLELLHRIVYGPPLLVLLFFLFVYVGSTVVFGCLYYAFGEGCFTLEDEEEHGFEVMLVSQ